MLKNPFTPVFGGKPDFFFGRKAILNRFNRALIDRGSEDRALFITGTRGSGKTALVEQLSVRAQARGWKTIDLGPDNTVHALVRRLVGYDEETKSVDPSISVSIFGTGGSIAGMSTAKATRIDESDLDLLLIDACARERHGVMVTIDEVQKLSEHDMSAISNAFQMASRKGCEVILVVAGLPFSHDAIIGYHGCTFMRRAVHERIGLLSHDEVTEAFATALGENAETRIEPRAFDALVQASYGHPYMVQLLGYYLVEELNAWDASLAPLGGEQVEAVCSRAVESYRSRALRPMVSELSKGEADFLEALARSMDEVTRSSRTAEAAELLGKNVQQVSAVRDRLLKQGLIVASGRGELMFTVPYLADYLKHPDPETDEAERLRAWGV